MQVSVQDITSVPLTLWLRKGYIIKKVRRENKTKLEKTIVKKKKKKETVARYQTPLIIQKNQNRKSAHAK